MLRTKFKYENEQRAITPKIWHFKLWLLCTALLLNEIYLPMKFHIDALITFKLCSGQNSSMKKTKQRAITPKILNFESWFLCTALLLNEICLPIQFHVDALHSFKVMLRTKKGRTDESITIIIPPFGGIRFASSVNNII